MEITQITAQPPTINKKYKYSELTCRIIGFAM